ncbi:uncharacterized protein BJ171DRAFT_476833 [Polychytrium aggregatum]|uniref:uncharacterized protein n=1 Tax=Polychytrium aggregatum TaxID=110093 RepID=UPI0022FE0421|nr:uncharacterized protein BJ171DRAFT_476833 [Polychytrium aggregatum]KAI9202159.1 hypothetical protein BJ171DRAFT_476833 [Polychytrium aggregatum]
MSSLLSIALPLPVSLLLPTPATRRSDDCLHLLAWAASPRSRCCVSVAPVPASRSATPTALTSSVCTVCVSPLYPTASYIVLPMDSSGDPSAGTNTTLVVVVVVASLVTLFLSFVGYRYVRAKFIPSPARRPSDDAPERSTSQRKLVSVLFHSSNSPTGSTTSPGITATSPSMHPVLPQSSSSMPLPPIPEFLAQPSSDQRSDRSDRSDYETDSKRSLDYVPGKTRARALSHVSSVSSFGHQDSENGVIYYRVRIAHNAQRPDELTLVPGESVSVWKVFEDAWCHGYSIDSEKTGFFPLSCIRNSPKLYTHSSSKSSRSIAGSRAPTHSDDSFKPDGKPLTPLASSPLSQIVSVNNSLNRNRLSSSSALSFESSNVATMLRPQKRDASLSYVPPAVPEGQP